MINQIIQIVLYKCIYSDWLTKRDEILDLSNIQTRFDMKIKNLRVNEVSNITLNDLFQSFGLYIKL